MRAYNLGMSWPVMGMMFGGQCMKLMKNEFRGSLVERVGAVSIIRRRVSLWYIFQSVEMSESRKKLSLMYKMI